MSLVERLKTMSIKRLESEVKSMEKDIKDPTVSSEVKGYLKCHIRDIEKEIERRKFLGVGEHKRKSVCFPSVNEMKMGFKFR